MGHDNDCVKTKITINLSIKWKKTSLKEGQFDNHCEH